VAKGLIALLTLVSVVLCAEITSKSLRTDPQGRVIAEGSVEAIYRGYLIRADRVEYDPGTKEVFAKGRVYIKKLDGSFEVWGTEAYLNLKEERGYFVNAQGKFERFYFTAERVEKVGDNLYEVSKGEVTTCPPEDKELKVCFWKAKITEGYVFSFSNSLKFFNVPFLYSPLIAFPVGDRRTGLLPPMIGTNSYNDFIYIQPFFWAISKDKDATFTVDYRSDQGSGVWAEYRQAISLRDRLYTRVSFYKEPTPPGEWWDGRNLSTFRENRFRLEFELRYGNWSVGLDLPSDPYFFEDVYFSRSLRTKPFTLSYINYTRLEKDYFLALNLRSYYDLTSSNQRTTLNLLPELGFYYRPKKVGPLFLGLTTLFTNFYREDGLRTKRLVFLPKAELPVNVLGLRNYMSLEMVNNFYFTENTPTPGDERITTFRFEDRLPLFFQNRFWKFSLTNVLEGVYSFSPEDYNPPQLDTFDRVVKENNAKLRYSGYLSYRDRQVASLFLEGGYNMLGSYRFPTDSRLIKKKLLPIRGILSVYPAKWLTLSEDFTYDANLGILARSVSSVFTNFKYVSFGLSYITSRDSYGVRTRDQYSVRGELRYRRALLGGKLTKDNLSGKELYRQVYLGVRGACWALKIDFRRTYYGVQKGYLREVFLVFNIFNLRDFRLPLRRR